MEFNLTVAIDDVHPEYGWGMPGDKCVYYLDELNKEFGTKFTLFIPSNYHRQYPISQHKEWIDWLMSMGYFELMVKGFFTFLLGSTLHLILPIPLQKKGQ